MPDTFVIPIVAGIGNALMALPMVHQLREAKPNARIIVVAMIEAMAEPFRRLDRIETFVTGRGLKSLVKGIRFTRSLHATAYLVPFPSNRWQYNIMAFCSGADRVIMHSYPVGGFRTLAFLNRERVAGERGIHDVVQNLKLLRPLGIQANFAESPVFELRDSDRTPPGRIATENILPDRFVVVHAGSAKTILAEAKRWPAEKYASLIQAIRDRCDMDVVVVEGPDEVGVASQIVGQVPGDRSRLHVVTLRGGLGQSAAVLARAKFYVGTDSGLAHLSAAVGRRAITLFAPADPDRVCPYGNRSLVVQPQKSCSPCFLYPWESTKPAMKCKHPMCITEITVEQVMQKIAQLLLAK